MNKWSDLDNLDLIDDIEHMKEKIKNLIGKIGVCKHLYLDGPGTRNCFCHRCGARMRLDAKNNKWIPWEKL